jgi:hypothetical protein
MRVMLMIRIINVVCLFSMATSLSKNHSLYDKKSPVVLINTVERKNCFISYVSIKEKQYLVKQKKDSKKQLAIVRDALSAWIAGMLSIAHKVEIIDGKTNFIGKNHQHRPATLHTLAPGKTVREQNKLKYSQLQLRQFWAEASTTGEKGLTRLMINHMTWHHQLPQIIALDLFIGNSDRHCGNLCYDPATDSFCAIDMDDTFNKDLCELAYQKLSFMLNKDKITFTRQELRSLSKMRETLKSLMHKHKPKDIIEKMYYFAKKAGFAPRGALYNDRIRRKLLEYEKIIIKTNDSAHKLLSLIDKITGRKRLH